MAALSSRFVPALLPAAASLVVGAWLAVAGPAAAEPLHVGKASPNSIAMVPADVALATGMYKKHGLDVELVNFSGPAKMHQAMAAGSLDIGVGAGTELEFIIQGAPEIAIADMAGPPLFLGMVVPYESPARTADDLRGKRIGVSSAGSITAWMTEELARVKGWGPNGIITVALGGEFAGKIAAMRTGQVDGNLISAAVGFQLEKRKEGRLLIPVSDYVKDFVSTALFASNKMTQENPAGVTRFLAAWLDAVAFMRANKAETVRIARTVTGYDQDIEEREYDLVMPMFSDTGKFGNAALDVLERSFDPEIQAKHPDMTKLYTEKFLPPR
jgi:ABC-type nitrate/sulfonate/bicarbonate transport system substrate-binding protein